MADRKVEKAPAEFRNSVTHTEAPRVQRYYLGALPAVSHQSDGGAATGVAGDANLWHFPGGNYLWVTTIGTQTLIGPRTATTGVDVTGDAVDSDGRQIDSASSLAAGQDGRDYYTVGGGAFYAKLTCTIGTFSGMDDIRFGFRLGTQAFTATQDNYTDVAGFQIVGTDISTLGILNNQANVATDTAVNVGDGGSITMEVKVANDGAVTCLLGGTSYPVYSVGTTALVMDAGDKLCMYWYHLSTGAGGAGNIVWTALEHGLESARSSKTIVMT